MNGNARYITVTDKDDGLRITIGVDWIKTVVEAHDGSAIIELVENRKGMYGRHGLLQRTLRRCCRTGL